jgi:hypothetical protein
MLQEMELKSDKVEQLMQSMADRIGHRKNIAIEEFKYFFGVTVVSNDAFEMLMKRREKLHTQLDISLTLPVVGSQLSLEVEKETEQQSHCQWTTLPEVPSHIIGGAHYEMGAMCLVSGCSADFESDNICSTTSPTECVVCPQGVRLRTGCWYFEVNIQTTQDSFCQIGYVSLVYTLYFD